MAAPASTAGFTPRSVGPLGPLADELLHRSVWSDELVAAAGLPVVDMPFVTVGGGLGSFVMVDYLRIAGVPASHIRTLTVLDHPWQNYEYLLASSQVTRDKRIRSDSSSTLDNIWGFPGYAIRESFAARSIRGFVAPLWNVLTENVLCDYWTPKSGQVFRSIQREADRIDYWSTLAMGRAHVTRRRHGGGYFTVLTRSGGDDAGPTDVVYRSSYVHLAVGYPGLAYLPDLVEYRRRFGDSHRVVNAYEPHEHVYEELNRRHGSTVIVRGAGIVASQVLDRLISDRDRLGNGTTIVHLFRTYVEGAHGPSWFKRRRGEHGWAYQGFNWPKSTWGGQDKNWVRRSEGDERAKVLRTLGGTTTPRRRGWRNMLDRGRREGFYRMHVGEVDEVVPGGVGVVVTRLRPETEGARPVELESNFVIDATGLEADIAEHTLLADLLQHSGAERNLLGRLDVAPQFEVRGTRAEPGRLYAVGAATLGGYLAGVDTFLGLQIAALEVCDDLARQGFCRFIGVRRSIAQWWKWALARSPG